MGIVKKQHYVPQFYLKRWHNDISEKQVYVLNKTNSKVYSSNIQDIASSNFFYDFPKLEDEHKEAFIQQIQANESLSDSEKINTIKCIDSQIIEQSLSQIETKSATTINKIIQRLDNLKALPIEYFKQHEILSLDDIDGLSIDLALQYSRTEEMRMIAEQVAEKFYKIWVDQLLNHTDKMKRDKDLVKSVGIESLELLDREIKDGKFTKDSYTIKVDKNHTKIFHLGHLFKMTEDIANMIRDYKWIISVNNTSIPFYTSDNPVVKKANLNHPFYSFGFQSKGIEIYYPLSPNYALHIYEPSFLKERAPHLYNLTLLDMPEEAVIHYNDLIVLNATEKIFSKTKDFQWALKRISEMPKAVSKNRERIA